MLERGIMSCIVTILFSLLYRKSLGRLSSSGFKRIGIKETIVKSLIPSLINMSFPIKSRGVPFFSILG